GWAGPTGWADPVGRARSALPTPCAPTLCGLASRRGATSGGCGGTQAVGATGRKRQALHTRGRRKRQMLRRDTREAPQDAAPLTALEAGQRGADRNRRATGEPETDSVAGGGAVREQPPGDRGLTVGGLVLVDDALARRLVELAGSLAHQGGRRLRVARLQSGVELADRGLQRRLDRLVAQPTPLVLPVALDLRLDVRHAEASSLLARVDCRRTRPEPDGRGARNRKQYQAPRTTDT